VENRQGRQVHWKSIHIKGLLRPQSTAIGANLARLMVIWDHQNNSGTGGTEAEILNNTVSSICFTNLNNKDRFTILRDITWAQGAKASQVSDASNTYPIDIYVNLKGYKTQYSGTTAAIGAVATGNIILLTTGTQVAGQAGDFELATRERFWDN